MSIQAAKAGLRRIMGRRARELPPEYRARASAAICRELLALPELEAALWFSASTLPRWNRT